MIVEHSRFEIWNAIQHPYKHELTDFGYANPGMPGVGNIEDALNYFFAALYPVYQGTSATPGDLPTGVDTPNVGDVTPSLNDYRVVLDDGDTRQAGYRWEQRENDVAPKWYKIYDVDWSTDGILAGLMDVTQDVYVYQKGKSDLDENGDPIVGFFAGQTIKGGNLTTQNLTLDANSADATGFVQVSSNFRPTSDAALDLGTATEQFDNLHLASEFFIGTTTISPGSIIDSSGEISFDDENLVTTGSITGESLISNSFLEMTEILTPANASAGTNRLYFKADNALYKLDDAGNESLVGLTLTSSNDNRLLKSDGASGGAIQESGIIISDLNELTNVASLTVDSLLFDGNTISTVGNLILSATSQVIFDDVRSTVLTNDRLLVPRLNGTLTSTGIDISAANAMTGVASAGIGNLSIIANTVSSTAGNLNLTPFSGLLSVGGNILPDVNAARDIGSIALKFANLFLSNSITDGIDSFVVSELMDLRSANFRDFGRTLAAQTGDSLFYDGVNGVWLANSPDAEISHPTLSNLTVGDSGHTQFPLLVGRSGGQIIQGGVSASENLTLESTSNATKGHIVTRDHVRPEADASYSAGWQGNDLGQDSFRYRNLYLRGESFGLRPENVNSGTLPASSANNAGRMVYATDNNKVYVDTGSSFIVAGVSKFNSDIVFDGIEAVKDVDVSSVIGDARTAIIQLLDNANDFERITASIKATSTSNVRITTNVPLTAGSYRLIVME